MTWCNNQFEWQGLANVVKESYGSLWDPKRLWAVWTIWWLRDCAFPLISTDSDAASSPFHAASSELILMNCHRGGSCEEG